MLCQHFISKNISTYLFTYTKMLQKTIAIFQFWILTFQIFSMLWIFLSHFFLLYDLLFIFILFFFSWLQMERPTSKLCTTRSWQWPKMQFQTSDHLSSKCSGLYLIFSKVWPSKYFWSRGTYLYNCWVF